MVAAPFARAYARPSGCRFRTVSRGPSALLPRRHFPHLSAIVCDEGDRSLGAVAIQTLNHSVKIVGELHGLERTRTALLHPCPPTVDRGDDGAHEGAAAGDRPAVERIGEADIGEREAGTIRVEDLPGSRRCAFKAVIEEKDRVYGTSAFRRT